MNLPKELRYTEEHEWVQMGDGNKVRIGITDFAQSELGDIVFVELPEEGAEITAGEPFGSVESVKTVSELYAPVSGKVVEVNGSLEESPENVNDSPYGDGWMIVVELSDSSELENLLTAEQYEQAVSED
ncbi:glycine cleavage system protein GcvH [Paenactinomyces guangxiensis]|uniref:Glycine cleavage system H protein n=1 Tax=Paenactinomyces guangxiensis TaxID=1490290 RepID=A0A7W2A9E8_9BACL|nr:glycine cleavage system protein GcvH [Paenactinomyces guangxiensis]MBA4494838.1 glycine cleavage system protein GcvH [Paenactinomyces guangxiensis]MBH8591921.1 glycine cleavage system protein GcvH [Paenactinomyces guangxiensis]